MNIPSRYWKEDDLRLIGTVIRLDQALGVCRVVISRVPKPVSMVSGPISTGGRGSVEKNLEVFGAVIKELSDWGYQGRLVHVFSQMPAEAFMVKLWQEWRLSGHKDYFWELLEKFYLPIFQSRQITSMFFIPGWRESTGARWEFEECGKLGIKRIMLDPEFVAELGF